MNVFSYIFIFISFINFGGLPSDALDHKFYLSVTDIEYVNEQQSLQIISRIFVDDFESAFQEQHEEELTFDLESQKTNRFIETYLQENLILKINDSKAALNYIGSEFDNDIVICYLEVESIKRISSLKISNQLLLEVFDSQENIVKTNINNSESRFILNSQNYEKLLVFE